MIADPDKITQILMNLIGNAVNNTEKGEIKTRVDWQSQDANEIPTVEYANPENLHLLRYEINGFS